MSERPRALEILPHLKERIRGKLLKQITEVARPFFDWDLESNKLSPEDEEKLARLTNEELIHEVNTEGFRRRNLLELRRRITNEEIDIEMLIEEDEMTDHSGSFRFIKELAIIKLNGAAFHKGCPKKNSDEILPDKDGVKVATEHYAKEGLITREDITAGGISELQEIIQEADLDPIESRRIDWRPSIIPPERVSIVPPGTNPTEVSPAGPTEHIAIPSLGKTGFATPSSEDSDRAFDISDMRSLMSAPTVAVPAMLDEIGKQATMAIKVIPEGSKTPTLRPLSLSHSSLEEILEDPNIIIGPAAYITDVHGNEQSGRIPLINRKDHQSELFTIGCDIHCDIYIDFPGIAPLHGEVKFENGKMFMRGIAGAFIKTGGGSITREWEEVESNAIIKTIAQKGKNGNGPHSAALTMPHFRVSTADLVDRQEIRETLKERAFKLRQQLDSILENKSSDDEIARQLVLMIDALVAYNDEKQLGSFTLQELNELVNYFSKITKITNKIRQEIADLVDGLLASQKNRYDLEEVQKQEKCDRAAAIYERINELGVDYCHFTAEENPATANILYQGPAFSFENMNSTKEKTYYPADLLSSVTIGTHPMNTHEMKDATKGRIKNRRANFMVEFYKDEEDEKFKVRYLGGLVQIKIGDAFVAPSQEVSEIQQGQIVRIGNYKLQLEEGIHAFSEETFMNQIEGEKGLIYELLELIENQEHTTWEQDEKALDDLCYILGLDLPEERKQQLIKKASTALQKIYEDLLRHILDWQGDPDSGYFQTLLLLIDASNERGFFHKPFPFTKEQIREVAKGHLEQYLEEARRAYKIIEAPEEPILLRGRGIRRLLGIPGKEQRRYNLEILTYEEERELYAIKLQEQKEAMKKTNTGAVEIARFIEFGLIQQADVKEGTPEEYKEYINKIVAIRRLFKDLKDEKKDHRDIFIKLQTLCEGMNAPDIFAPEEISTRSLHCQVNLQEAPHITGSKGYIHQLAKIYGGKALERLNAPRGIEETAKDLDLINGLLDAGIINVVELNTSIETFKDTEEIMETLGKKEKEVDSQRTATQRKKANELYIKIIAENEEKRRDEYLKRSKEISLSKEQAEHVDVSDPEKVETALIKMMMVASYALNPKMAQIMSGVNIVVPKKVEIVELEGDSSSLQIYGEELVKDWKEYQEHWRKVFLRTARKCAQHVCMSSGLRAESGYRLIQKGIKGKFFSFNDLSKPSHPIEESMLIQGVEAEKFIRTHLQKEVTDLSYLEFKEEKKDQDFWNDIKAQITRTKLELMVQEYQTGNKKLFYQRKIKKLQRQDSRAIKMLNNLNLSNEERDLLQIGK